MRNAVQTKVEDNMVNSEQNKTHIHYVCSGVTRVDSSQIIKLAMVHGKIKFSLDKSEKETRDYIQAMRMFVSRQRNRLRAKGKQIKQFRMQILNIECFADDSWCVVEFGLDITNLDTDVKDTFQDLTL